MQNAQNGNIVSIQVWPLCCDNEVMSIYVSKYHVSSNFVVRKFCEWPFGGPIHVFIVANGRLVIYNSYIKWNVRRTLFLLMRGDLQICENKVPWKLELTQYLFLSHASDFTTWAGHIQRQNDKLFGVIWNSKHGISPDEDSQHFDSNVFL